MPRIYDSASNPIDFCHRHFPKSEEDAFDLYGNGDDGPDDRGNCFGYDCEHPDYQDSHYRCHVCSSLLTAQDN
jgi:hypothetical protein